MQGLARERTGSAAHARADAAPAKRRVCFVAPLAWPVFSGDRRIELAGGAEVQQSLLARLLARRGHAVSMITLDYGQPDASQISGVTVHKAFAPDAGLPVLRFLHPRLTAMWSALRRAEADIYYCRSASMWLWLITEFCRRHGRRAVYAGASDKDFEPQIGGQVRYARDRWLYRRGLAAADAIVAQNEFQRASCLEHYGRRALVIPSCYEPPVTSRASSQKDLVLWVGTLHQNKRPELFLELAARLPARRFVLIGGPRPGARAFYERIRAQAAALANVEATGFLPLAEAERWFDRARVLVNTSTYEGMPNTFLQAWARGVPTLATVDVGASVSSVFADPAAAAREIERLFADEDYHALKGKACRAYFERHHSPASVLARYEALFREMAP
jgi:glycosyltransferase involved in cell wall biosynthesis